MGEWPGQRLSGCAAAWVRAEACARFHLPGDRLGDLVVVSVEGKAIGTRAEDHDLSGLTEPLRSHGGLSEQIVPLVFSRPVVGLPKDSVLNNYDIFSVALNDLAPAKDTAYQERKAS